jgi:hypothetical protein
MVITDLKTYVREYTARAKREVQAKRAMVMEEKARQKLMRRQGQRRRDKETVSTDLVLDVDNSAASVRSEYVGTGCIERREPIMQESELPNTPGAAPIVISGQPSMSMSMSMSITRSLTPIMEMENVQNNNVLIGFFPSQDAGGAWLAPNNAYMDCSNPFLDLLTSVPPAYYHLSNNDPSPTHLAQQPYLLQNQHQNQHLSVSLDHLGAPVSVPVGISMPTPMPPDLAHLPPNVYNPQHLPVLDDINFYSGLQLQRTHTSFYRF